MYQFILHTLFVSTVTFYNYMCRYVNLLFYSGSDAVFCGQHHNSNASQWVSSAVPYQQLGTTQEIVPSKQVPYTSAHT